MANALIVKKGDNVLVLAGKDKGKKGKVLMASPSKGRVWVERINLVKRHTKPTQKNPTGGIVEKEAPIDASNVRLICPSCGNPTRAKRHALENGKTMRRCDCGESFV